MYKLENNVAWTDELKEAFKHGMTRASILYDGTEEINEENNLVELTLTEKRYINDYGFIGTATARKLNITIQNTDNNINLENKDLTLKIGAVLNNDTYYINYGNFIVYDAPETDETNGKTTIVAYDYMKKFDQPYVDRVNYPCTLLDLLQDVCDQAGVTLATTDFANYNFSVENNQFEGNTLRDVLMNIAKCAFSWARIGQDNRLYLDFSLTADATENITIDEYKLNAFKKANEYYGPINRVVYADSDIEGQEEKVPDVTPAGDLKELVIYDNLFAYTPTKRRELIQAGTRLLGLTYMPVSELNLIGFIYLDCRDIINIGTLNDQNFSTRVFNHTIHYNGAVDDSVVSEGTSTNQDTYKNTANSVFQNQQTKIIVDKAVKKIEAVVGEVTDHENKITRLEADVDGIETQVSTVYDLTNIVEGVRQVTLTDCMAGYLLELHIKGNNYVFKSLYPSDDLFPSDDLYILGSPVITVTDENNIQTMYDLKINEVLRANDEVYDEYILKDNNAKIIRRVNKDGTTRAQEVVENLGKLVINISEGTNVVRIKDYYADISIKYVIKNAYTDQFISTLELGTQITQNAESVKVAWNQISEALQMMIINGNASLAVIDKDGNVISNFDKTGQHFYDSNQNIIGHMGVKTIKSNAGTGEEQTSNYIAFSIPVDYGSFSQQGMAWGVETPDGRFFPVMFIKNFYMAEQQAGDFGGQVELNNCDMVVGATSGITNNAIRISGEPTGEMVFTSEVNEPKNLITLYPEGHYEEPYSAVKFLDKIFFFKNQNDNNALKVGDDNNYSLFTDNGVIQCTGCPQLGVNNNAGCTIWGYTQIHDGNLGVDGNVYADNISSDRRYKKDIKECEVNAIDKIMQIRHKQFTKITDNKHYDIGYIAQDMEEIDSNFVLVNEKDEDKTYYINELPIIATLTKAIQEQQTQIEDLKKRLEELENDRLGK